MKRILPVLALLLAFFIPVSLRAQGLGMKELFSAAKGISSPVFSPDGKRIAFVLSGYDPGNGKIVRNIWIMDGDGGNLKQLTNSGEDLSPCWSGDGREIAFLSARKGVFQIWIIKIDGGEASQITDVSTGISSFEWSGDNKFFVFMSYVNFNAKNDQEQKKLDEDEEKSPVKARVYNNLGYRSDMQYVNDLRPHLFSVNLADKKINKITSENEKELFAESFAVSADGKFIARVLAENPMTYIAREVSETSLNNSTGSFSVSGKELFAESVKYSPDGRFISYLQWDRNRINASRLIVYNRESKTTKALTPGFKYPVNNHFWSPQSDCIYFEAANGTKTALYKCNISSGKIKNISDGFFGCGFAVSGSGRQLVFIKSSLSQPDEVFTMSEDGKNVRRLTCINQRFTDKYKLRSAEHFIFEGAKGSPVEGMLIFPPDFNPAKKYPLLLLIHGGPYYAFYDFFEIYFDNPQLYSSQGYIVAEINIRGSIGYGAQFANEVANNYGGLPYEDLMSGVDYLLAKHSFIDKGRMAVLGHSYGGYLTNWIVGHTDRFKCAVTMSSLYNLFSQHGAEDLKWLWDVDFGGKPWERREIYEKWSPHNHAGNFKTPTFVIHGELDYRVPVTEGLQMFSALQLQNIDSQLMILPDEGHLFLQPRNQIFIYNEVMKWLDKWCK